MGEIVAFLEKIFVGHSAVWLVGQAFGVVAIVFGFLSYQMKTQRGLLLMQGLATAVFSVHYGLIGAYTGMALNMVGIVRAVVYDYRIRKGLDGKAIPLVFVVIMCVLGTLTWEAWYSIFVIFGLGAFSYAMSFKDPQKVRKVVLVISPFILTYDLFAGSVGGCVYDSVSFASALLGFWRHRKRA